MSFRAETTDKKYPGIWQHFNYFDQLICPVGKVFANGPRDLDSIRGRVILKIFKTYRCLSKQGVLSVKIILGRIAFVFLILEKMVFQRNHY